MIGDESFPVLTQLTVSRLTGECDRRQSRFFPFIQRPRVILGHITVSHDSLR